MTTTNNPLVFLDLAIGSEKIGRIVIRLFKDITPIGAESFRQMCTGEKNKRIAKKNSYKDTVFHRASDFGILGGGVYFEGSLDKPKQVAFSKFFKEKSSLKHDKPGILSLVEKNNKEYGSEFCITKVECEQLDGSVAGDDTYLVIGEIVAGMGTLLEATENTTTELDIPKEFTFIYNCGEIKSGEDWGISENDESEDPYPIYPEDLVLFSVTTDNGSPVTKFTGVVDHDKENDCEQIPTITTIKNCGNHYFKKESYRKAAKKYTKALRYFDWYDRFNTSEKTYDEEIEKLRAACMLNLAACKAYFNEYENVIDLCDKVLEKIPKNPKALYRRGQALHKLNDFDKALKDLLEAKELCPTDHNILKQIKEVQKAKIQFDKEEMKVYGGKLLNVIGDN